MKGTDSYSVHSLLAGIGVGLVIGLAACSPEPATEPVKPAATGHQSCGVVCTLTLSGSGAERMARVAVDNPSHGKTVQLLAWDLPEDGNLTHSVFRVLRDGKEVPYRGPAVTRGAPRSDDYLSIPAGYQVEASFRLAEFYDLAVPGEYEVRYVTALLFGGPGRGCDLTSNSTRFRTP